MKYSDERREAVLRKMLPPNTKSINQIAAEEGISRQTLLNWRKQARTEGRLLPDADLNPEGWSSVDKFNAVVQTSAMNEIELGEYCRAHGLYPEQICAWRAACEQASLRKEEQSRQVDKALRQERRERQQLERELQRKEKALAEAAALLTLRKKTQAIWGTGEDD